MLSSAPFIASLPQDLAGKTASLVTVHGRYGNNALNGDWELGLTSNTSAPPQHPINRTWNSGTREPFTFSFTNTRPDTFTNSLNATFSISGSGVPFDYGSQFARYEPNAIKIWARTTTATSGLTINDLKITTPGVAGETVFPGTSIAVSQASGTVFQEIIIAGIDLRSVSGGTVTLEGNVTMQFGTDPALRGSALQFHVIATHIPWVDLDVDSNNNGTIDLTNGRRGTDDRIEQAAPGKIIPVGGERAEMLVTLPAGRNATLEVKPEAAEKLKFYTQREGGEPLAFHTFGPNDEPAFDMSLVPGRQRVGATDSWTLWVEATGPSTTAGDLVFTLTGDSNGPPAWDVVRAKLNAAPNMNDQTRNVFVGEPDEALVGPRLNATDPDGDTLTWSIVAGSAPADLPFEIDARTGQISVEISAGGLRVLNTEYQQSDIAKKGEYTFDVKVDDGQGNAATATVTITLTQVKVMVMGGVTIRMRGKSLKSTTAVAGYILQGGRDGVGGPVGGLVKEAAEELLKNAKGGRSAGMHIMSSSITANGVGSDAAVETPYGPELEQAFLKIPIFANTVFDTHFWARNRMGRTLAFLARMEFRTGMKGRGIAADESTALIVTPEGIARVVAAPATSDANRNIYMFDASIAVYGSAPPLPSVIYTGTIVHKLSVGHQFNIATWQPIETATDKQVERFYLDVDYYQPWFIRRRNWLTGAIDYNRYGDDTPTVPNKTYGAER